MKKYALLIFIFLTLIVISYANYNRAETPPPLEDFSVTITYSDSQCSCGEILAKLLDIEIWDIHADPDVLIYSDYDVDITNETSPFTYYGSANIIWNCQGCYKLKVQIEYFGNEGKCCDGANFKTCDGEDLINGESISVTLN